MGTPLCESCARKEFGIKPEDLGGVDPLTDQKPVCASCGAHRMDEPPYGSSGRQ